MREFYGDYRDLGAWREAILLLAEIHLAVKTFPEHERPDQGERSLGEQIFRAAVSVPARIAEGRECEDRAEFLEHLRAAAASLAELGALLVAAEQLGYVSPAVLEALEKCRADVSNPLRGLAEWVRRELAARHPGDAQTIS